MVFGRYREVIDGARPAAAIDPLQMMRQNCWLVRLAMAVRETKPGSESSFG